MAQHEHLTRRQSTVTRQTRETPAAPPGDDTGKGPRRVRLGNYRSFRLHRKSLAPAYEDRGVPGGLRLLKVSLRHLWRHRRTYAPVTLVFALANLLLAGGILNPAGTLFESVGSGDGSDAAPEAASAVEIGRILLTIGSLFASGGGQEFSQAATALRGIMLVLASMAFIWVLRRTTAGKPASAKGAWYSGTTAFVPFMLVLAVLLLEMVPFTLGAYLFISLVGDNVTINLLEDLLTGLVFFLLATVSFYWVSASMFALQVVTLPNTTPMAALRSAHELVRYRRGLVLRRLAVVAVVFALVAVFVVVPVAITVTAATGAVFFVLSVLGVLVFNAYVYHLYRELIG